MVVFPREENEGALKINEPAYGNAHLQLGLETRPEPHEAGIQLFGSVEYDVVVLVGREQNLSVTPDSIHIGLLTSIKPIVY